MGMVRIMPEPGQARAFAALQVFLPLAGQAAALRGDWQAKGLAVLWQRQYVRGTG